MTLYFCQACGHAVDGPDGSVLSIDAEAMRAWQEEIAATCQHTPICTGPWAHAVRLVREEVAQLAAAKALLASTQPPVH